MSELPATEATLAPTIDTFSEYFAKQAKRDQLDAELRPANKVALFDVLASAGIVSVVVNFDGYGDSGQIESVDARDPHGDVALPAVDIEIATATFEGDIERRTLPIGEAVEALAYDLLGSLYSGWENNDGAYGDITFDVAARAITLDYNGRYTAVETYTHVF